MKSNKMWDLTSIWNDSLDIEKSREYVKRDHCYASELGRGFYDRYWKMKGRVPTSPPSLRARRKFQGGNLTEWIVLQILARAGVLKNSQEYITYEDGPIKVTGRADFMAGGEIQLLSKSDLQALPESFADSAEFIVAQLKEKHPEGLREVNLEVKSCAGIMFEKYQASPSTHHCLQAFHYAKNTDRPTMLVYVSRDDFRICSYLILPDSEQWGQLYDEDLKKMSWVVTIPEKNIDEASYRGEPIKEPLLTWDGTRFSKNFEIEYSSYLTDYGYERPDQYSEPAASIARRLNNIVKKIREDKPIDGKVNLKTLEDCYKFYPGAEEIIVNLQEKE